MNISAAESSPLHAAGRSCLDPFTATPDYDAYHRFFDKSAPNQWSSQVVDADTPVLLSASPPTPLLRTTEEIMRLDMDKGTDSKVNAQTDDYAFNDDLDNDVNGQYEIRLTRGDDHRYPPIDGVANTIEIASAHPDSGYHAHVAIGNIKTIYWFPRPTGPQPVDLTPFGIVNSRGERLLNLPEMLWGREDHGWEDEADDAGMDPSTIEFDGDGRVKGWLRWGRDPGWIQFAGIRKGDLLQWEEFKVYMRQRGDKGGTQSVDTSYGSIRGVATPMNPYIEMASTPASDATSASSSGTASTDATTAASDWEIEQLRAKERFVAANKGCSTCNENNNQLRAVRFEALPWYCRLYLWTGHQVWADDEAIREMEVFDRPALNDSGRYGADNRGPSVGLPAWTGREPGWGGVGAYGLSYPGLLKDMAYLDIGRSDRPFPGRGCQYSREVEWW